VEGLLSDRGFVTSRVSASLFLIGHAFRPVPLSRSKVPDGFEVPSHSRHRRGAELCAEARQRPVGGVQVSPRRLDEEARLLGVERHTDQLGLHRLNLSRERRLQPQPDQLQDRLGGTRRLRGADHLVSGIRGVEAQVKGKLPRPLAPRGEPGQQGIEKLFQDEQQSGEIVIGEFQVDPGY
jgi:hypothetical protein